MRVIVAEDAPLFRAGLEMLLREANIDVVATIANADDLGGAVDRLAPDVLVTDIRMPPTQNADGLLAALAARERHPGLAVVVLSQYLEAEYAEMLLRDNKRGSAYLLKDRVADTTTLVTTIERVAAGETVVDPSVISALVQRPREHSPLDRLTSRERDVLALIAEGRSNQGISDQLFISLKTIETHVTNIMNKLGLTETPDDNRRVLAVLQYLRR